MSNFKVQYIYELIDKISPDLKKIESEFNKLGNTTKKTGQKTNKHINQIATTTNTLKKSVIQLGATYLGARGFGAVVNTIANFDTQMSKVHAITGATIQQLGRMRNMAKELGSTTEFSATQVASGMTYLGMAGFQTGQIIKSMSGVLDLATASGMDLASASDIASNILTGFNMKAEESGRMADVIAKTVSSANTNVYQLGDAMSYVAPIAESSNISLERTSAILGALSDSGLQASMAGTGLRRIISELAKPTKEATDVLKKYGLTVSEVNVKKYGLLEVLEKIKPIAESTADSFTLFGDRGAPAFQVLSKGTDKVKTLQKALEQSKGTAKAMADVMRDNLGGDLKELKSTIEGLTLATGDKGLTKALRGLVKFGTGSIRAIAGDYSYFSNAFITDPKEAQKYAKSIISERQMSKQIMQQGGITPMQSIRDVAQSQTTNALTNQQVNLGGKLEITMSGIPKGSQVNYTPDRGSSLQPRITTAYN